MSDDVIRNALEAALETVTFLPVRRMVGGNNAGVPDVVAALPMDIFNSLVAVLNETKVKA